VTENLQDVVFDDEPVFDPDCRDSRHGSCVGGPCECGCHDAPGWITFVSRGATDGTPA
jgi:hypothetical protein